jgi:iron complex transport system ATP-binding protein
MAILQADGLSIGYQTRQATTIIAQGLGLQLDAGQLVCLLGPNGAGKSTLMRTLVGMQAPLAGQVRVGGDDVMQMNAKQRAMRLSVVLTERPQAGLLNGYALVALGRHPHTGWTGRLSRYDEAVVRWAVDAVDAGAFAERPLMTLSDGQRQKLMVARALAQEADVIVLDEPTAFLDLPRRAEMMRLLKQMAHETKKAILLSTHDLDLALRSADRLWLMADGQVHVGAPEDLVLAGIFEEAFRGQGVQFDRETGAFRVEHISRYAVQLQGQGVAHTWTERALRRAGFTVLQGQDDDAMPQVMVEGDDKQAHWQVRWRGYVFDYENLQALLEGLAFWRRISTAS